MTPMGNKQDHYKTLHAGIFFRWCFYFMQFESLMMQSFNFSYCSWSPFGVELSSSKGCSNWSNSGPTNIKQFSIKTKFLFISFFHNLVISLSRSFISAYFRFPSTDAKPPCNNFTNFHQKSVFQIFSDCFWTHLKI